MTPHLPPVPWPIASRAAWSWNDAISTDPDIRRTHWHLSELRARSCHAFNTLSRIYSVVTHLISRTSLKFWCQRAYHAGRDFQPGSLACCCFFLSFRVQKSVAGQLLTWFFFSLRHFGHLFEIPWKRLSFFRFRIFFLWPRKAFWPSVVTFFRWFQNKKKIR